MLPLVLLIIVLWGIWGFFSKIAVSKGGFGVSFWESLLPAIVIALYLLLNKQILAIKTDPGGAFFAFLAGTASGLATILFFLLLKNSRPVF